MMSKSRFYNHYGVVLLASAALLGGCATTGDQQSKQEAAPTTPVVQQAKSEEHKKIKKRTNGAPVKDSYDVAVEAATDPLSPTRLILVSRYGHNDIVEYLLNNNVDVNVRDKAGYSPLIAAAEGGHLDTVKLLLAAKADVSASKSNGETALMVAANSGYTDVMRVLLDAQALVDAKNAIGETALFNAVKYGRYDAARLLLSYDANPNIQNTVKVSDLYSGYTPLMYAAGQGIVGNSVSNWDEMVSLLLDKGARPNTRTSKGDTALAVAQRRYDPRIIALLESSGARQERSYTSLSEGAALVKASRTGDVDKVKELLDNGVKVNVRLDNGVSALLAASFENQLEVARVLIKHGVDVNNVPIGMRKWAMSASGVSITDQELIKAASRGDTALLVSLRLGYEDMVDLLLGAGADPTINNHQGDSPVFVAASVGSARMLKALLAKGVDPNTLETEKLTVSMTNTLQVMGRNTPLITAAQNGHAEAVKALLDANANPNHRGFLNKTALLWATERGHQNVVSALLAKQADTNLNDIEGTTPLISAAKSGNAVIVDMLIKSEADPNKVEAPDVPGNGGKAFGSTGMTALMYAARGGYDDIVKLLIDAGANVNAMSRSGDTAMQEASKNGYAEIVKQLRVAGAQ